MYPTVGFRRWIADNESGVPFGVAVDDGDAELFELVGVGLTLACGEQAVLRRTATSSTNRTRFTLI
jgi:hypothetical protein